MSLRSCSNIGYYFGSAHSWELGMRRGRSGFKRLESALFVLGICFPIGTAQASFPKKIRCESPQHAHCLGTSCGPSIGWTSLTIDFKKKHANFDGDPIVPLKILNDADGVHRTAYLKTKGCPYTLFLNSRDDLTNVLATWTSCDNRGRTSPTRQPERGQVFWGYSHARCRARR